LWWIPSGHIPTVADAVSRLEYLREHGPTPQAFTFKQRFTPQEFIAFQKQSEDPF
ncbi:MAG: DUF3291 domain-containing protein, partial [Anaerolineae bacterium]|nr:DUF3291 domain-containing protein [Anaerolineae bacterium]